MKVTIIDIRDMVESYKPMSKVAIRAESCYKDSVTLCELWREHEDIKIVARKLDKSTSDTMSILIRYGIM